MLLPRCSDFLTGGRLNHYSVSSWRYHCLLFADSISLAGHMRRDKMLQRIQQKFYWPSLFHDLNSYCHSCPENHCSSPIRCLWIIVFEHQVSMKRSSTRKLLITLCHSIVSSIASPGCFCFHKIFIFVLMCGIFHHMYNTSA